MCCNIVVIIIAYIYSMNKHLLAIKLIVILIIGLPACQKEDFTLPVTVSLKVELAGGSLPHLHFDQGIVMFNQIFFDGNRQQGGDVHFFTDVTQNIGPIQFTNKSAGLIKNFDIPQGVYSYNEWRFELDEIDDDYLESIGGEQMEDLEGGLIIAGTYTKQNGSQLPLYIVVDENEIFKATSKGLDGYEDVAFTTDKNYSALLVFDLNYAMNAISIESLEAASVSNEDDDDDDDDDIPYIEISSDENKKLYELVLFRLGQSVKVIIN